VKLDRATYLEKVICAPTKELADMYYDLAKKKYLDREKEKVKCVLHSCYNFDRNVGSRW
jgi:hypothetical protein